MHNQKGPDRGLFDPPYFQLANAAAMPGQSRVQGTDLFEQLRFMALDQAPRGVEIYQVEQLHLPDHLLGVHPGFEATGLCQLCHV